VGRERGQECSFSRFSARSQAIFTNVAVYLKFSEFIWPLSPAVSVYISRSPKAGYRASVYRAHVGEFAMPKKSLAKYVRELRKELLAKNCQGEGPPSDAALFKRSPRKLGPVMRALGAGGREGPNLAAQERIYVTEVDVEFCRSDFQNPRAPSDRNPQAATNTQRQCGNKTRSRIDPFTCCETRTLEWVDVQ